KANAEAESFYQSSPLAETRAAAALPDRTEPSPTVKADPKPKKAKAKEEPKEPEPEQPPTPEADATSASEVPESALTSSLAAPVGPAVPKTGMVIALLLLILVGPTVLVSQLPPGRFVAIPLAVVGLLGGLFCLGAEGRARFTAALAAFLHFVTLAVLLFSP